MKTHWRYLFFLIPVFALAAWCVGCGGDDVPSDFPNSQESSNPQVTNAPASLSSRTFSFIVTANQSFAEEFSTSYVIDFETPTTYTLHPSSQNNRQIQDEQGNYTYERVSGRIQLVSSTPVNGRVVDMQMNFITPTSGTAHLSGRNGETQDVVFNQISP